MSKRDKVFLAVMTYGAVLALSVPARAHLRTRNARHDIRLYGNGELVTFLLVVRNSLPEHHDGDVRYRGHRDG